MLELARIENYLKSLRYQKLHYRKGRKKTKGRLIELAKKLEKENPNEPKTFSDLLGGGEFYPDFPRIEFRELLDRQVLVVDAQIIENFSSQFGVHDALLILVEMPENGEHFTTITSGEVIIKRVMKALKEGLLPLKGTITKGDRPYYNIL